MENYPPSNRTRTDTMRSNSTTKSDLKLVDSNPSSNAGLDVNSIVLVEGGADQGLVQPYGITNLIHKGLEVRIMLNTIGSRYGVGKGLVTLCLPALLFM